MILGCLLDAPSHGYEIRQRFKNFYQRSHGINEGQLYTVLKKMEEEELVRKEVIYQEKSPPRKVFHITEEGRKEFYSWLFAGCESPEYITGFDFFQVFPFLQKCTYFNHVSKDKALKLVDFQITAEKVKLDEFKRVKDKMLERKVNRFRIDIIEFGITFQQTKLAWLEGLKGNLSGRNKEVRSRGQE